MTKKKIVLFDKDVAEYRLLKALLLIIDSERLYVNIDQIEIIHFDNFDSFFYYLKHNIDIKLIIIDPVSIELTLTEILNDIEKYIIIQHTLVVIFSSYSYKYLLELSTKIAQYQYIEKPINVDFYMKDILIPLFIKIE